MAVTVDGSPSSKVDEPKKSSGVEDLNAESRLDSKNFRRNLQSDSRASSSCTATTLVVLITLFHIAGCFNRSDHPVSLPTGRTTPSESGPAKQKSHPLTDPLPTDRRHALLIGCSAYDHLDKRYQLRGPANDVRLMRQLLVDRFRFEQHSDDIVTLAASEEDDFKPSRANIEREFVRLAKTVRAGEHVVVLMAGHGSQQPDGDPDNPRDIEPDGLDEIFLASDVKAWDGERGAVENAIVDDELHTWVKRIVDRGAFVWLIIDACYSGTGVRGNDTEVSRNVPTERLVPREALAASDQQASTAFDHSGETSLFADRDEGGLVAVYAAQPNESTPERKLPLEADRDQRKFYGLLTYCICEIMGNTSRNLTYNELVQAIQTRYVTMGRRKPTPLIEGTDRDRLVLGHESPKRSQIMLQRGTKNQHTINAGLFRGIREDSVLAVYPPTGSALSLESEPIGHVKVVRADLTRSNVRECEYDGIPVTANLPDRGRCEMVYETFVAPQLRVAVDPVASDQTTLPNKVHKSRLAELRSHRSTLVEVVDDVKTADWLVRSSGHEMQLVPASGVSQSLTSGYRTLPPATAATKGWETQTIEALESIARARVLLGLASMSFHGDDRNDLGFQMSLHDSDRQSPIEWQSNGLRVRDGQKVRIDLENRGADNIDVTLLYIDSGYGINCLYPLPGETNRLQPSDSCRFEIKIKSATVGLENLVAIVVRGAGQPVDFSILAQPSLSAGRTRGIDDSSLNTPLGELIRSSLDGGVRTRGGIETSELRDYEVSVVSWSVEPAHDAKP